MKKKADEGKSKPGRIRPIPPICPQYLSPIARAEWKRIVPELERVGLISKVDGGILEAYCNAYAAMVGAQKVLNEKGMTYETETGYYRPRPEVSIFFNSANAVRSFAVEIGLTPSARTRMTVSDSGETEDEMERFLRGAVI